MIFPSSMVNGERGVVVLFVSFVLFSLPFSLLCHGLNLAVLFFFALFLDIRAENSASLSQFNTRPGTSSGILLGAVTLPAVMISKLIQLSRAYSLHQIELQELEHMTMQYWATSASCFGVLIYFCIVMHCASNAMHLPQSYSVRGATWSLICIVLYAATCCVSLATISHTGSNTALKLLWELFHGLVAVKLLQRLLNCFPSCASIGEVLLVTTGLVLYFGDMLAYTIAKVSGQLISTDFISVQYGMKRSEISIIIQGVSIGLLLFPIFFRFVLHICGCLLSVGYSEERSYNEIRRSILFFTSLGFILIVIAPSWMQFVHDFQVHPILWVFAFVFSEPFKRLSLCIYWVSLICASILRFYNISKNSKIERILLRKYYHLMAVLMFVPALIFQPKFLDLAFGAALAVFLAVEIMRVWRIWPLGQLIHQFMNAFTDHRDSDLLIVSHFSLLLGCAFPIWMSSGFNDRPLAPFAGILSLGIGDTMASMVGYKYGVLRWSKTGKKTVEGTAAGITSVLAACSVLLPLLASTGYILSEHWFSLILAVTLSGLLEAYTTQLDNAFIPLIFYSLLCL
ncbi:dolichol kinase EVAN [Mangifera indica]|uniref:dolichol kinase EVAN n=1 Tax=Mangifera indica TaxID=29780 RepID=UPI001CF9A01E|nr:dolichol kinase EVAN [Mangifera indica]XP_044475548.1 dolichol kinase EVAN [Mangifera indica]XP_044475555.1 dolichol kinase EVAN [Mangifera indica]